MKHILWISMLILAPAAAFAAPGPDTPSTTGVWKIEGAVRGRPVNMMCTLAEEQDHKLSGTCSGAGDDTTAHKIDGKVKAQKVEFHFDTAYRGSPITLMINGKLNEDSTKMNGGLDVEPLAVSGSFTATREATPAAADQAISATDAPALLPHSASTSPAAGTWQIEGDVQGTPVKLTCVLKQADDKLSGTCTRSDNATPAAVTGALTEKGLGWKFDSDYEGQAITVSMQATLESDNAKMTGTMLVTPFNADGTFSGVKQ